MEKKRPADDLKPLSEAVVGFLKTMAEKGIDLNAENLLTELKKNEDVQGFFDEKEKLLTAHVELESKIKAASTKNNRLLQQVNELDSDIRGKDSFYRQALLSIIRMIPPIEQTNPAYTPLSDLKTLLQQESKDDELKRALQNLKTASLSEDIDDKPTRSAPPSFLGRLLKGSKRKPEAGPSLQPDYIQPLKTAYQELMDDLRLNLANKDLNEFSEINTLISDCTTLEDLVEVRKKILSILRSFTDSVSSERELTADFIKEITSRLFEIEKQILQSASYTDGIFSTDGDFNIQLKEHIDDLKTSINFSKSLEELKTAVLSRLNIINEAIETKEQHDRKSIEEMAQYTSRIRQDLERMKKDVVSAKERSRHLEEELLKDPLTGVFNRRAYDGLMEQEFSRYTRYGTVFSIILFDVDHFKRVNDTYGHAIGDTCLTEILKRVKPALRETDLLARYGGEEFIILLPETDSTSASQVAEKIRQIVENIEFVHKGEQVRITISLGVTEASPSDKRHQEIFTRMDQAMYEAKQAGRNRVEVK